MNDKCIIVTRQNLKGKLIPFVSLPNILSYSWVSQTTSSSKFDKKATVFKLHTGWKKPTCILLLSF